MKTKLNIFVKNYLDLKEKNIYFEKSNLSSNCAKCSIEKKISFKKFRFEL
jgi:hypothetical protein